MSAGLTPVFPRRRRDLKTHTTMGKVDTPAVRMFWRLARAAHADDRLLQAFCNFGPRDDHRTAAVGDDAAVEAMQRVGDQRRVHDFFHRHDIAQQRMRVVLGVMRGCDLDPGQLFGRRAEFVHVAHRHHGVHVGDRRKIRLLELRVRHAGRNDARRGAGRHAFQERGLPASVISATLHLPMAIACAACDDAGR